MRRLQNIYARLGATRCRLTLPAKPATAPRATLHIMRNAQSVVATFSGDDIADSSVMVKGEKRCIVTF